jgi:hypothetical protein
MKKPLIGHKNAVQKHKTKLFLKQNFPAGVPKSNPEER